MLSKRHYDVFLSQHDIIKLKPANEVYIQLYKQAKNKAKEIKKTAIEAYLEAKEIKDKYNLYDIDDSEDELENLIYKKFKVDDEKRDDLNKRKDELPSKSLETIGRVALAYKLNKK